MFLKIYVLLELVFKKYKIINILCICNEKDVYWDKYDIIF